ncbi:MAG: BMP family ABC transporter substrate-binding protein, partial [bacterium]
IANIELAISGGAKVIITPGYMSEYAVFSLQNSHPDVNFIMLDSEPRDKDESVTIAENTTCILYKEEEAGFLAGYSAVMDGYRELGFMGGIAVTPVINFGYGFIDGAEYASRELNLSAGEVNIRYTYLGTYDATPDIVSKASSWYNDGTEVIFACAGGAGASVMKAAEISNNKVIGVDVDQSEESSTVITSSMKNVYNSLYNTIDSVYTNTFNGGELNILGTETGDVLLPIETSNFNSFTKEQYDEIYNRISSKTVRIATSDLYNSANEIALEVVQVYID